MIGVEQFRFTHRFGTGVLYTGVEGDDSSINLRLLFTVCFLAPDESRASYTLGEAWSIEGGVVLLLGEPMQNAAALVEGIRSLRLATHTRILWIANPNDASAEWQYGAFTFTPQSNALSASARLNLTIDADGYAIVFGEGCTFDVDAAQSLIRVRAPAGQPGALTFGRGERGRALTGGAFEFRLAETAGLDFRFAFALPEGVEAVEWLDALDVGLRYAFAAPTESAPDAVASVRFPLVSPHPQLPAIPLAARVCPSRLTDQAATQFAADFGERVLFTSWFRTVPGQPVQLATQQLALSFAWRPERRAPARPRRLTLVPSADFTISVARTAAASADAPADAGGAVDAAAGAGVDIAPQLLCGGSGAEYIEFGVAEDNRTHLRLVAGQPAFAATYSDTRPVQDAAALSALSPESTTAWIQVRPETGRLPYFSQPAGDGTLYTIRNRDAAGVPALLEYFPIPSAYLEPAAAPLMPMVPLAGAGAEHAARAIRLEGAAISPARKRALGAASRSKRVARDAPASSAGAAPDEGEFTCITPRGLQAQFRRLPSGENEWVSVTIAQLQQPAGQGQLFFRHIAEPLLSALLANQQCLVVSDPAAIKPFFGAPPDEKDTEVTIGGWRFFLHPDGWAKHGTILILKNADAPLRDLALDTSAWTSGRAFNRDVNATRQVLRDIIERAEGHARADRTRARVEDLTAGARADFDYFVDVVLRSPAWNGFLFLNVPIGEIPGDLAALKAGIDPRLFFAHHLGVTQSFLTESAEPPSTAMFGLIRYDAPAGDFGGGREYAFRVEDVGVLFRNSAVESFRSAIGLYVAALFGQAPVARDGATRHIRMEGSHQRRGDLDTYMFSMRERFDFRFEGGPLAAVSLTQAEFETLTADAPKTPAADERMVRCRFSFVGTLTLADLSTSAVPFDVFSFETLAFSNLGIEMSFPEQVPAKVRFAFDIAAMQLLTAQSRARAGSLFEGFPVKLGAIVGGRPGGPGALGYMTVNLTIDTKALGDAWYGLSCDLDMGTLTDVAGAAGLTGSLVLAWGPGPGQAAVGLKLPGSGGSTSELSLLGVLKLSIFSLALRRSERAWALMLNGVTLKVLSKELPPGGSFDFYLFGNPDRSGSAHSLGWYGAYLRAADKKKPELGTGQLRLPDPRPAAGRAAVRSTKVPPLRLPSPPKRLGRQRSTDESGEGQ